MWEEMLNLWVAQVMFNKIKGGGIYTCYYTAEGGGFKAEVEAEY